MPKKALIAEPDETEAKKQAAILTDEGFEVTIADEPSDLVRLVETSSPDVIILRHERPGQSGLALVNRLKKQKIAPGSSIVLTTSDLAPEAIEKHKGQKHSADRYVRLPLSRKDLLDAALAVATTLETTDVDVEAVAEPEAPRDPGRPPPLPGRLAPRLPSSREGAPELSGEDLRFVEKVFSSIQHVDPETPPLPEATSSLDGPDRKVALLRKNLKDRERELAKLSRLWRTREEALRAAGDRFQQKEIEVEGLKLRVSELEASLDQTHREMDGKVEQFGRDLADRYDSEALREAELIQEVASKENELNKLRRKVDRAEEEAKRVEKELTDRVFEWERAYKEYETHHWQVMLASYDELMRLEDQLAARDAARATLSRAVAAREEQIARLEARVVDLEGEVRATAHAADEHARALAVAGDRLYLHERAQRLVLEDDQAALRVSLFDAEILVERNARLLPYVERQRQAEIQVMDAVVVDQARTIEALTAERAHLRSELDHTREILDTERALGEAAVARLFRTVDTDRLINRTQIAHRDRQLDVLHEDVERLTQNLNDVTERLSNEEMEHAAETARAEELDQSLHETRKTLAETEERLTRELASVTTTRDKLEKKLEDTQGVLETTKEALQSERLGRQGDNQEARLQIETRDAEIKERTTRIGELERDVDTARTDIQTLRQTVAARDDRVTELLARIRQNDEQIVALESKSERLTTTVAEQKANLEANADELKILHAKLGERDARIDTLEQTEAELERTLRTTRGELEAMSKKASAYEAALAKEEDARRAAEKTVVDRDHTIAETVRERDGLNARLADARAEIQTTATVLDEVQARLAGAETRVEELRRAIEARDGQIADLERQRGELDGAKRELEAAMEKTWAALAAAQEEIAARDATLSERSVALTQRDADLAERKARIETLTRELQVEREKRSDVETAHARDQEALGARERDIEALRAEKAKTVARAEELAARLAETEATRASLEEQLAQQITENGELGATANELRGDIERMRQQLSGVEGQVLDRESKLKERQAEKKKLEAELDEQRKEAEARHAELVELRAALDDQKVAVEERARWVQAREARIAELEAKLAEEATTVEGLRAQLSQTSASASAASAEGGKLKETIEAERRAAADAQRALAANLDEERRARAAVESKLKAVLDERTGLVAEKERAAALAKDVEARAAREAALAKDAAETKARADKLAGDIEKAKAIATRVVHERDEAKKALAELEGRLKIVEESALGSRSTTEALEREVKTRDQKLQAAQQMLARTTANAEALERRVAELEEKAKEQAAAGDEAMASARQALEADVKRLQTELLEARKGQRDAIAAAQQARAERDNLKKNAEAKLKELAARLRASGGAAPTGKPPASDAFEAQPTVVSPKPPGT